MRLKKAPPRVLLGSPFGHSGKTVISCGISRILRERGYKLQTFKKGPDYVDPSWLSAASGRPCRNLDLYLMGTEKVLEHFVHCSAGSDFALIEGNMGLYDGLEENGFGSSAHLSRLLKTPVVLVVNTEKITRSIAALVKGYMDFEPETMISAVILNRVSGERHALKLIQAIEKNVNIPVLGVVPKEESLLIAERHLGLIPFGEERKNRLLLERIASFIERHVDVEGVVDLGKQAQELVFKDKGEKVVKESRVKIGVFYDHIFNFYYPENLEALIREGADLVFINSTAERKIPEVDGLYIGGGFPELHLKELTSNRELMDEVAQFVEDGKPVYAECGGLMYLCDHVFFDGYNFKMVGLIPAQVLLTKKPQGHGYVEAKVVEENPYYNLWERIKGHEFHYSTLKLKDKVLFTLRMERGKGGDGINDGILYKNMFASYMHIHALGVPSWAERFVRLCRELKEKNECNYTFEEARHN